MQFKTVRHRDQDGNYHEGKTVQCLRRSRGPALFPGPHPSLSLGAPFWPSGLTVRRSRPPTAAAELRALGLTFSTHDRLSHHDESSNFYSR